MCHFPPILTEETESALDSSGLSLGSFNVLPSFYVLTAWLTTTHVQTDTLVQTQIKRLSHKDLTLDKRPNFMFGINYLSFPPHMLTPLLILHNPVISSDKVKTVTIYFIP